jgi:6-phosphofructokinase 1
MSQRIGIVTGGGDCPGLNAVIRAVAKAADRRGWEAVGIVNGFEGLLEPRQTLPLDYRAIDGLLVRGGTILGTANRGRFSAKTGFGVERRLASALLDATREGMQALGLDALVTIGGDGTLNIAWQMYRHGLPVVGVPKTIDNDVGGTVLTFGFASAVDCVTMAIDKLHTTAESHRRVMVVEVMGRFAGWIALYGGIAGGADVILIPEIPFGYERIVEKIRARESAGRHFTMVVAAEGAHEREGTYVTAPGASAGGEARLGGIGGVVAAELERRTGKEARTCVLGHLQRGGTPSALDRMLCSMFGTEAIELIAAGKFGQMVAFLGHHVGAVGLEEAVARLKTVPPDGELARTARALGICLGC